MATYAIGDIQGYYQTFLKLLDKIQFDPKSDKLWFVGDVINRGQDSLAMLRWLYQHQENSTLVLGNHEFHLLSVKYTERSLSDEDTIQPILLAPDSEQLCTWLRQQPLIHYDPGFNTVLCHAGIYPLWSLNQALTYADEVTKILAQGNYQKLLENIYGNAPNQWHEQLTDWPRIRFIIDSLTRMRFINKQGELNLTNKGKPESQSNTYFPWFNFATRATSSVDIIFGHWAALEGKTENARGVYALDYGCGWGKKLAALRVDDRKVITVENHG